MKCKRVLVLNQFAVPRSMAGGTRHVELFEKLTEWDVTIIAGRRSLSGQQLPRREGSLLTVPVTPFTRNGWSRVVNWLSYAVGAFASGLFRERPTVVYGSSPHLLAATTAFALAKIHRARFVLEVRDLWPQILVDSALIPETALVFRLLKFLERFVYRRADAIVVLAEGSIEAICAEGIDRSKIEFIPNGADPDDFEVAKLRTELRAKYELSGTVIVYAGAHGPANGLTQVLDAAEELRDTDAVFLLVGQGVLKQELVEETHRRRLTNVQFRDPIVKTEIPELFAAADIGLHCLADLPLFHHGVSPNKLYDYMAAGMPVITNTPGEVAALVEEANAGEAVGPNEIALAAKRLLSLHPDTRSKLGQNGRDWMASNRSRQALAHRLDQRLSAL